MKTAAFPQRLNVEPTNHCNLRCRLCPHSLMKRPRGFMDLALFHRLVDECRGRDVRFWLHYLGEPLLHPHIISMVAYAVEQGIPSVGLSTNATIMTRELSLGLIQAGLHRLECSVDALSADEYLEFRGKDEFDTVVESIRCVLSLKKQLHSQRPILSVQYMTKTRAAQEIEKARRFWRQWLGPGDFIMTIQDISFAGRVREGSLGSSLARTPCEWPFRYAVVLWNGDVVPCDSDFEGQCVMGNLEKSSLEQIWHNTAYKALREVHLRNDYHRSPICRRCDDWNISDGSGYRNVLKNDHHISAKGKIINPGC
ncbi:MAG: SPASM domain-containing protein [Deltaproteobacteria bacterium]|nr:SPASM domain-containing protein [Deltaproteobacteria bacterium]